MDDYLFPFGKREERLNPANSQSNFQAPLMEAFPLQESLPVFTQSEVTEMENLFREVGEESLRQDFCEDLAASFSSSTARARKPTVSWKQVQSWFQDRKNESAFCIGSATLGLRGPISLSKASVTNKTPETSIVPRGAKTSELSDLAYEAKSSKDSAWYDVASFLNYRMLTTGELEARVRFSGFGNSHDEWLNIKTAVRPRSIPLEASECHRVKVGDLVLCFQERSDYALYVDAHVIEIQRRLHDIKGCRCIFVVRFDYDDVEEKVQLSRICCRP
ncbi:hypothetical protein V2J09_022290 [Rumex salicifolius]